MNVKRMLEWSQRPISERTQRKSAVHLPRTQLPPAAHGMRRFSLSPVDALVHFVVRCRLRHQIPIRLDVQPVIHLRVAALPQRWPACRGDARRLRISPNVFEYLPDVSLWRSARVRANSACW